LVHAFMFFIGSSLAVFSGWGRMKSAVIWICAGVLLEYYQFYFTTDRSFDWFDVMANATGVFMALVISKGIVLNRR
jgi:hypothetical protein